jgi:Sulfotransferase family
VVQTVGGGARCAVTGHLIHIGYAKAASKFLQNWFAQHPQLSYMPSGIAGFRDVYAMAREAASGRADPLYYVTSYEGLSTPHASAGREAVDYDAMQQASMPRAQTAACELLAALFPNAHILIVTRGFRSMGLSSYSQYVRSGGLESIADLCASLDAAKRAPLNYDLIIGLYRGAFGDAKVIVLPYELLRDDAAAFLGEIARRLGLSAVEVPPCHPNPSLTPIELAWYPRLGRRLRALPLGARGRRMAWRYYVHAAMTNRLRRPIALLQRLRPLPPVDDAPLTTSEFMQNFRGLASSLRDEPLYRAYGRDYLFD